MALTLDARLYLTVAKSHNRYAGNGTVLLYKIINTLVPPAEGEQIELWEDGPLWDVKQRWWKHDGAIQCDLKTMVVDPDDSEESAIRVVDGAWHRYNMAWRTELDGDPLDHLLGRGGWSVWLAHVHDL